MRVLVLLALVALAGCGQIAASFPHGPGTHVDMYMTGDVAAPEAPTPIAAAATPDLQEGGPVTVALQRYIYEEDGALWDVSIRREALGEPGRIDVIGPDKAYRARFYAAKACLEEGGRFQADVEGVAKDLPQGSGKKFVFEGGCL